jgi:hypothetical protein
MHGEKLSLGCVKEARYKFNVSECIIFENYTNTLSNSNKEA